MKKKIKAMRSTEQNILYCDTAGSSRPPPLDIGFKAPHIQWTEEENRGDENIDANSREARSTESL